MCPLFRGFCGCFCVIVRNLIMPVKLRCRSVALCDYLYFRAFVVPLDKRVAGPDSPFSLSPQKKGTVPIPNTFRPSQRIPNDAFARRIHDSVWGVCVCVRVRVSPIYSITYGHKHIQYSQIHIAMIMRLVNEPAPCRQTGNWQLANWWNANDIIAECTACDWI